ncbi:MAG: contractile injection system tape measure protein, partial [Bacteroidota bacterium]
QKTFSTDTKYVETVYAQNGIYVNNAGLVLVYPFLSHYFQKTELMDENESFHSSIAQEKAALLLHYLLYREPPKSEHELVLNKLLCGIPLAHAIDLSSRMDELAIKEGKKMLKAVINNWEALGNTDVPSLTEAFLTRKGKLEFRSSHIHLLIQKESMDILLGRIPWTLSFVKLPFMQKLIKIDW